LKRIASFYYWRDRADVVRKKRISIQMKKDVLKISAHIDSQTIGFTAAAVFVIIVAVVCFIFILRRRRKKGEMKFSFDF
jgi:hypothetical protein